MIGVYIIAGRFSALEPVRKPYGSEDERRKYHLDLKIYRDNKDWLQLCIFAVYVVMAIALISAVIALF
jgi:hypothetical protein